MISGVGRLDIFPQRPFFEISVDSNLLRDYGLSAEDVKRSINSQNTPAAGGFVGAQRVGEKDTYFYSVMIENSGYIQSISDFKNIVVKRLESGAVLRVKDIGDVKYTSSADHDIKSSNGYPGVFISVNLKSGSNAVGVGENVGQLLVFHETVRRHDGRNPDYRFAVHLDRAHQPMHRHPDHSSGIAKNPVALG